MSAWIGVCLFFTGIVVLIDYILRRKKWSENSRSEKNGLALTLLASFPFILCSAYGILLGIVGPSGKSSFMIGLYNVVLIAGKATFLVCLGVTIASLVLRKIGKARAANWALVMGLCYCVVFLGVSFLV